MYKNDKNIYECVYIYIYVYPNTREYIGSHTTYDSQPHFYLTTHNR